MLKHYFLNMKIKIASRSSKLALKQVQEFVKISNISDYELLNITTEGDKLSSEGSILFDKANFVTDIEINLLNDSADLAVHSAKDMPAKDTEGLEHLFFIESSERRLSDLIIFKNNEKFKTDMILGTSSLRRKMQAKFHLNAENVISLNGNIDTRLKKLNDGMYDCIVLAEAGLHRLDYLLKNKNYFKLNHITCSGQGVLAVQWKKGSKIGELINSSIVNKSIVELNNQIELEKKLLRKLDANCNSAISLHASNGIIKGEIYGLENFISFNGTNIEQILKDIDQKGGLKLLHEHN